MNFRFRIMWTSHFLQNFMRWYFMMMIYLAQTALLESGWKNKGQMGTYRTFSAFSIKPHLRLLARCSYFLACLYLCDCRREGGTAVFQRCRQRGWFNGRALFMRTGELRAINFVFMDLPRTPTTLHSAPCPSPSRPL